MTKSAQAYSRGLPAVGAALALWLNAGSASMAADNAVSPTINPPATARQWADLAKLPDWGGVWLPENYMITTARHPPPWAPQVIKDVDTLKALDAAGHPKGLYTNCLPEGMPSFIIMTVASSEFLFTPGRVTILNEFDGNRTRRIYTDGRGHPDDPDLTFNGHSIGRWEGDTLVVDTVGILPETYLPVTQSVGVPNDGGTHVVERIHLIGPDHLVDELTIEAPHVLAAPWHVTRNFTRSRKRQDDIQEGSCRQGDFIEGKDAQGHAAFLPINHDEDGAPLAPSTSPPKP